MQVFIEDAFHQLRGVTQTLPQLEQEPGDRGLLNAIAGRFGAIQAHAESQGLTTIGLIARKAGSVLAAGSFERPLVRNEEVAALERAVDVLMVMVGDVRARMGGKPAADLDDATRCFFEHVERLG